jgi:hypothetical protein
LHQKEGGRNHFTPFSNIIQHVLNCGPRDDDPNRTLSTTSLLFSYCCLLRALYTFSAWGCFKLQGLVFRFWGGGMRFTLLGDILLDFESVFIIRLHIMRGKGNTRYRDIWTKIVVRFFPFFLAYITALRLGIGGTGAGRDGISKVLVLLVYYLLTPDGRIFHELAEYPIPSESFRDTADASTCNLPTCTKIHTPGPSFSLVN